MIDGVDGYYIAAEVRLLRQVKKGSIILVEGDTDLRVMEGLVDTSRCEIQVAFGKLNVLAALDLLEDEGFGGILAIVDADFDRILNTSRSLENLFLTDAHDFDLMIFLSKALDRYVSEHKKTDQFTSKFGDNVDRLREALLDAAAPLGYFRLCSIRRNLNLYFKSFPHDELTQLDLSMDVNQLGRILIARSRTSVKHDQLISWFTHERSIGHDLHQLVNGHDVSAMLGIAIRSLLANKTRDQTWAREVEASLRLNYNYSDFLQSDLQKSLVQWEKSNPPFKIFAYNVGHALGNI